MEVIGVGVGRTGTLSLKVALEKIGFTPCYHMLDVIMNPGNIKIWLAISVGKNLDWKKLFKKYKAGVDYPFPTYYKKYMEKFPDTKVILTVREPERWYESAKETIYPIQRVLIKWLPWGRKVGKTTIWYKLLCSFLDVPIPGELFPHVNRRSTIKIMRVFSSFIIIMIFISVVYVIYRLVLEKLFLF
jgi:hypothetical protein